MSDFERAVRRYVAHSLVADGTKEARLINLLAASRMLSLPLSRSDVRAYIQAQYEAGNRRCTIANNVRYLRGFCSWLVEEGYQLDNPCDGIVIRGGASRLPRVLSIDQVSCLMRAPDVTTLIGLRDRAILELLYSTGIRRGELVALDLVDAIKGAQVRTEMVVDGKTGQRIVLLGSHARTWLDQYIVLRGAGRALFLNNRGRRLAGPGVDSRIAKYGRGIVPWRLHAHTLRHTFATHMLEGGANLRVVQELLGHASVESTMLYTHVSSRHLRQAYDRAHPKAQGSR